MLQFHHVGKRFGTDWAIVRFSLEVKAGELVWLDGPPGAGKSLLVRMALGAARPTSGSVIVNDMNPARFGYRERQRLRRSIGAVLEDEPVLDMTAVSWVALAFVCSGKSWREAISQSQDALERFGLGDLGRRKCARLSGRQRFAISLARALARNPHLLLIDWPSETLGGGDFPGLSLEFKRYIEQGGACMAVGRVQGETGGRQEHILPQNGGNP